MRIQQAADFLRLRPLDNRSVVLLLAFSLCLSTAFAGPQAKSPRKVPSVSTRVRQYPTYDLQVKISPENRYMSVTGDMQLPAVNFERNVIELSLSEQMTDFRASVLSPASSSGSALLDKQERPSSKPGWGTTTWRIRPIRPIPPDTTVRLRFSYGGGKQSSFLFYLGPEVCFGAGIGTAWYPEVEEFPVDSDGELRGMRGTGTVSFSVPSGYLIQALSDKRETGRVSDRINRFTILYPAYFSFSTGKYIVQRSSNPVPTSVYLLHSRESAFSYLQGASRVLNSLTQEFGPYPHSEFAVVEVPTDQGYEAGFAGASVDGFIFANTAFLDKGFNTAYFGHEISHQWWGNLIRSRTVEGRWMLNEGMAQFGSLRTVETLEGEAAAEAYRRTGYPGYVPNQNALGYFKLISKGSEHRLSDLPKDADLSRALADSKGFIVLDMLSRTIGRKRFGRILENFIRANAYQRVNWRDFEKAIEDGAGRNLSWFYEQWFYRTGAPDYKLSWRQEGTTVRGTVSQTSPYFRAALELEIKGSHNRLVKLINADGDETAFEITVPFEVRELLLDPHYKVLRWTPELHSQLKH